MRTYLANSVHSPTTHGTSQQFVAPGLLVYFRPAIHRSAPPSGPLACTVTYGQEQSPLTMWQASGGRPE
jgi:hypothetical protein